MRKLSAKRRNHAWLFGSAVGEGFLRDYSREKKGFFPKGLESLPRLAKSLSEVTLFTSCTWTPSEEEKAIAGNRAFELVELAINVAKRYKEE